MSKKSRTLRKDVDAYWSTDITGTHRSGRMVTGLEVTPDSTEGHTEMENDKTQEERDTAQFGPQNICSVTGAF